MAKLDEPFSATRDDAHPVRWSPADGDTPAYLTIKGAVERLTRNGHYDDPATVDELLRGGSMLRTEFAYYMIDDLDVESYVPLGDERQSE